jgi:hypothetical protein
VISSTTAAVGRGEEGSGGAQAASDSNINRATTQRTRGNNEAFCFIK